MLDLILYILLGLSVIALSVWGGIVSVKSLPSGVRRPFHLWGFIGVGIAAFALTVAIGIRSYLAQKHDSEQRARAAEQNDRLQKSLDTANGTLGQATQMLGQTKAGLDQSRLSEEHMRGQMEMIGPMLAKLQGDSLTGMRALGAAMLQSSSLAKPIANRYELLNASDLKREALELVHNLRELGARMDTAEQQISNERMAASSADAHQQWLLASQKEEQLYNSFHQQYDNFYKVEAKLLREEMMRREALFPDMKETQLLNFTYDNPTNKHGLISVADDLEGLARRIPDVPAKRHQQ